MPDECCIPTVVMNSRFRPSVSDYLCYIDWSEKKPHPKTLRETDLEKMLESPYLLARKFDRRVDEQIMDLLDEAISEEKEAIAPQETERATA